jgi:hypothetical protein
MFFFDTSHQMPKCYNCGEDTQRVVADDVPVCVACDQTGSEERKRRHLLKAAAERKKPERARAASGSERWDLWHFERQA